MSLKEQIHKLDKDGFYLITLPDSSEQQLKEFWLAMREEIDKMDKHPQILCVSQELKVEKLTEAQKRSIVEYLGGKWQ